MTGRDRVLGALNHVEADRVPTDFGGHRSSGIMVQAYKRLREHLRLPERPLLIFDFIQQLALIDDDVLDLVGADVLELGHGYAADPAYWRDWELEDGTECSIPGFIQVERTDAGTVVRGDEGQVICIQKPGCLYVEQTHFPLKGSGDCRFDDLPHQLQQVVWCRLGVPPAPAPLDDVEAWGTAAKSLRESTDRAIYGTFGGNLLETGQFLFRNDEFLCELAANPRRVHAFLDKVMEMHLANLGRYLEAVGPYIDIIGFGDDLGMQSGPQISPAMYREFFKPRHKALWGRAKELCPHLKVSLHSCGGIYPLLGDLIDAGLDAVNPVQFNCAGMELVRLKREFGRDLTFWGGGCDTRSVLPTGTPREIKEHVWRNLDTMAPGGGFVFQQVHNIMADVPAENVVAMFEAVREYGR